MKEFYNRVKERDDVLVLGIALEHKKDVGKLREIIRENEVEWTNVWNNFSTRKSLSSVHGKLLVESFPTYMIVDKDGLTSVNGTPVYYINNRKVESFNEVSQLEIKNIDRIEWMVE